MSECCEHCPERQETEDEAWDRAVRALHGWETPQDKAKRILKRMRQAEKYYHSFDYYGTNINGVVGNFGPITPAILPPTPNDPYRPRG